jgi:hypothetical protein
VPGEIEKLPEEQAMRRLVGLIRASAMFGAGPVAAADAVTGTWNTVDEKS